MFYILFIIFSLLGSLIASIIRLFARNRADITVRTQQGMQQVCYMDYHAGEVSDAYVVGGGEARAIGRVGLTSDDGNAHIELLTSDFNDDSVSPTYRHYAYLTSDGWIYKQMSPKAKPVRIGYTAKLTDPSTPTIQGEKTGFFDTKATLGVFAGLPYDNLQKKPVATVVRTGQRSDPTNPFTLEARACAFALVYHLYNKNDYREFYRTQPYGWADTALIASIVYSLLYLIYALLCKILLNNGIQIILSGGGGYYVFMATYVGIWALIRRIKIASVEQSHSIQPVIDMINKSLGNRATEWTILTLAAIAMLLPGKIYTFNYTPMIMAIITGVLANMSLKRNNERWKIVSSLHDEETEDTDTTSEENPAGDIVRSYEWALDPLCANQRAEGSLSLYFTLNEITELRRTNPFYQQLADKTDKQAIEQMFAYLTEHPGLNARLRYIVAQINRIADENLLNEIDKIQFTLDFVQEPNIAYVPNRNSQSILKNETYIRFPDETLYDKEGDCNSKALLAAMLFNSMKYNVMYLYSRTQQHAAIGIQFQKEKLEEIVGKKAAEELLVTIQGKQYIFCETTGDMFCLGAMAFGMQSETFDQQLYLPYQSDGQSSGKTETRIFNWKLDSHFGSKLSGSITLEMDVDAINDMRNNNPFNTYGQDNRTYAENVKAILKYATQGETRSDAVEQIANYIRAEANKHHLTILETLQFALDFVQEPNIKYCIDEESAGINFVKEYMRYPDEVLFDKEGDCDCKSSLTAALFHALGHNVIVLMSEKLKHAAIGVEYLHDWLPVIKRSHPQVKQAQIVREFNGRMYIFCETTSDGFRIGDISENTSINDFETVVELNVT